MVRGCSFLFGNTHVRPWKSRKFINTKKSTQSLQKLNNIMIPALKRDRRGCRQLSSKTHCKHPFSLAENTVPNSKRMLPSHSFVLHNDPSSSRICRKIDQYDKEIICLAVMLLTLNNQYYMQSSQPKRPKESLSLFS